MACPLVASGTSRNACAAAAAATPCAYLQLSLPVAVSMARAAWHQRARPDISQPAFRARARARRLPPVRRCVGYAAAVFDDQRALQADPSVPSAAAGCLPAHLADRFSDSRAMSFLRAQIAGNIR